MSELNKGHSTMGLPRASGKRGWSGEEGEDSVPAAKVLCTSPPHALCAEDVLQHPTLTHAHASTPALECELTSGTNDATSTSLEREQEHIQTDASDLPAHHHYAHSDDDDQSDDDFIDDDEDKDSGFIDSNSIDNSSDDEVEARAMTSDSGVSTSSDTCLASTSLQLSLSQVLAPTSLHPPTSKCALDSPVTNFVTSGLTSPVPAPSSSPTTPAPSSPITIPASTSPVTIDAPTSHVNIDAPTSPVTIDAPTSPITIDAPTSPITIDAPTSPITIDAPTSPITIDAPTSPITIDAPTPPVTIVAPTSPVTIDTPNSPVTIDTPNSPVTIDTPNSPVTIDAPNSPVTIDAPTSPVTIDTPNSPVTIVAPTSPVTIDTPTSPVTIDTPTSPVTIDTPTSPVNIPAPSLIIPVHPSLPSAVTTHTSTSASLLTITTSTSPSPAPIHHSSLVSPASMGSTVTTSTTTTTAGREERGVGMTGSLTTVTATQTGTVVTSTYQGALPSHTYETHHFTYSAEGYPARPSTPSWESCNYYDGSQPNTNKYMEISPSKSGGTSQSIQCDENGKSYMELGSASPYTHTYSSECGSYTTSPSSYHSQPYNQTYTSPSSYAQPNLYYNPRQSYSPNPYNVYPAGENYTNFEGETGCSYGYGGSAYSGGRTGLPPNRGPPRCMSPYCDPTRGSPRPSCYHQQRLSVLNLSMFKLNRFRQFPDPSLHRSVLICNTLRHIERELEAEGVSVASLLAHSHGHTAHPHLQGASPSPGTPPCPEPIPSSPPSSPAASEGPLPPMHSPLVGSPLVSPVSPPPSTPASPAVTHAVTHYSSAVSSYPAVQYLPNDHTPAYDGRETVHLRPYSTLPPATHTQADQGPSGVEESAAETEDPPPPSSPRPTSLPQEERTDAINWCSVLSLSSQTDLDSMNNNEYGDWGGEGSSNMDYSRSEDAPPWKLPSLSADDVLKSFPEASKRLEANEDLDSIINVLVGS